MSWSVKRVHPNNTMSTALSLGVEISLVGDTIALNSCFILWTWK